MLTSYNFISKIVSIPEEEPLYTWVVILVARARMHRSEQEGDVSEGILE